MSLRPVATLIALAVWEFTPTPMAAQSITLADALARAERDAFPLRASRGQLQSQQAAASSTMQGMLPALRVEASGVRTTDPIGVFGSKLRQQSITQADFAPPRLNFPSPKTNVTGAVVLQQPLVNLDAWKGRRAAQQQVLAAEATLSQQRQDTRLGVVQAFYQSILAQQRIGVLEAALAATAAHARAAASLAKNGLATPADELQAHVQTANTERELLAARQHAKSALGALCLTIGCVDDSVSAVAGELPTTIALTEYGSRLLDSTVVRERPDELAARAALRSAELNLQRARRQLAPRLNAVARVDWNDPQAPFSSGRNWTIGLMASWSMFSGGAELADAANASGGVVAARAMSDAARAMSGVERTQSRGALEVALRSLAIADSSASLAETAHRLVTRRYEGGLATIAELLGAAAAESASRLAIIASRYDALIATANYLRAHGADPGSVTVLAGTPQ